MDILGRFGVNLQRLRRERGLSQEQLAHLADCPRAYLSGAEAGRRNSTLKTIAALAHALDVDPADLLKEPDSQKEEQQTSVK